MNYSGELCKLNCIKSNQIKSQPAQELVCTRLPPCQGIHCLSIPMWRLVPERTITSHIMHAVTLKKQSTCMLSSYKNIRYNRETVSTEPSHESNVRRQNGRDVSLFLLFTSMCFFLPIIDCLLASCVFSSLLTVWVHTALCRPPQAMPHTFFSL